MWVSEHFVFTHDMAESSHSDCMCWIKRDEIRDWLIVAVIGSIIPLLPSLSLPLPRPQCGLTQHMWDSREAQRLYEVSPCLVEDGQQDVNESSQLLCAGNMFMNWNFKDPKLFNLDTGHDRWVMYSLACFHLVELFIPKTLNLHGNHYILASTYVLWM